MNWYFSTVMLEKTHESPVGSKEIQPIHPKGNHSWISIRRTDAEAEAPIIWPPDAKNWQWKRLWCWERLKAGGEGDDRGWDGWIASSTQWTWVGDGQGGLANCSLWGRKESDMAEQLNWIDFLGFSWWLSVKESSWNAGDAGDMGLIPGSRRSPGGRHGNWLQYACLDHPHGQRRVAGLQFMGSQSQTQLKWLCMQALIDFLKGKGKRVKLTINIIGVPIDFPALPRDSCVLRQCSNPPYWGLQSLLCSLERITFIHLNISCTKF